MPKGRQPAASVPSQPCTFEHENQVNEVSARIEELLGEISFASEDPAQPVPLSSDSESEEEEEEKEVGVEEGEKKEKAKEKEEQKEAAEANEEVDSSSSSDADVYSHLSPKERQKLAQRRLERLLAKLNIDERDIALGEVCEWLQGRVGCARKDLLLLGRLDRECHHRGEQSTQAAKALREKLQKRGRNFGGTVRLFFEDLGELEAVKRKTRMERSASSPRSPKARRPSASPAAARRTPKQPTEEQVRMTPEQLEAAIEELRERLKRNEAEARDDLKELQQAEHVRKPSDEEEDAEEQGDIYAEQEEWLRYLKDAIAENEDRARLIKEANDNLHGKVMMGRYGEVIPLSQEAKRISKQLQEEVNNTVLPELLAQREAEYGEELELPDEQRLSKMNAECKCIDRRIVLLDGLMARLGEDSVLEDDIAAQLRKMDAGELPRSTLLHDCLQVLEEGEDEMEIASDEEVDEALIEEGEELHRDPLKPRMNKPATRQLDVKHQLQASIQECAKVHDQIIDATENCRLAQKKLKVLEQEDSAVMRVLDILEEHKILFTGALAAARHMPSAEDTSAPPTQLVGAGATAEYRKDEPTRQKDKPDKPEDPPKDKPRPKPNLRRTLTSVMDAFKRPSTGPTAPKASCQPLEDLSWMPPFFRDEDNHYPPAVRSEQASALKAMADEERRLMLECHEIEAQLSQKVAKLEELARTKHGGISTHAAGLLTDSMKVGHEALESFTRSLSELTGITTTAPTRSEPSVNLQERRQMVSETLAKMEADAGSRDEETDVAGDVPSQARAAVQEALHLGKLNTGLMKRLDQDHHEVRNRRQVWARRKTAYYLDDSGRTQAAESRRVRQHTRALAALRMEIAQAVSQQHKIRVSKAGDSGSLAGTRRQSFEEEEAAIIVDDMSTEFWKSSVQEAEPDPGADLRRRKSFEEAVEQHAAEVERRRPDSQ